MDFTFRHGIETQNITANGNKIYTHVMQAQYITAYKLAEQADVKFDEIVAPEYGTEEWNKFIAEFPETIKSWNLKASEIFECFLSP